MRLVKKYRPNTLTEIVGQDSIIQKAKNILSRPNDLPHMLLVGPPGCGKTSFARCFAKDLFKEKFSLATFIVMNASDDRGIDNVRGKIKRLTKIIGQRIVYMGEGDNVTKDAQQALRGIMEGARGTTFIISGNVEGKLIPAILSRCTIFRFKKLEDLVVLNKLVEICKAENITIDYSNPTIRSGFEQLVKDANGDLRQAINSLEKLIDDNKEISVASVIELRDPEMLKTAIQKALNGNFNEAKEIIEDEYIRKNFDSQKVFRELYDALDEVHDQDVKIRLYIELGRLEANVRLGNNPLIQFVAFIAFCWIAPHMPKAFPTT